MADHPILACLLAFGFLLLTTAEASPDRTIRPNFISLCSTNYSSSGYVEIQPTFEVMLELLAVQYPEILTNYTHQSPFIVTPGSCSESELYAHTQEMMTLYRTGQLTAKPTVVLAAGLQS